MRQVGVYLCRPESLKARHEATDVMDKLNTPAGKKFAQAHIDAAVRNLMAGRAWHAKPRD